MNVAIFNLKGLIKISIRLIFLSIGLIAFCLLVSKKIYISDSMFYLAKFTLNSSFLMPASNQQKLNLELNGKKIIAMNLKMLENNQESKTEGKKQETIQPNNNETVQLATIPKTAKTQEVVENNLKESFNISYEDIKIKNQSVYELTDEILTPNIELENKRNVIIFHTHTCESYTSSEDFPYTMTGNYRTTDENYNMVRVGEELSNYLKKNGFSVIHDKTMHDYPSYTGSYDRSYTTVENILYDNKADIIIDLHRDAVGDGSSYGPKVNINGEEVAQLMFVIGTDGSGLEHPNWQDNLKFAIKVQQKANEMYPRTI